MPPLLSGRYPACSLVWGHPTSEGASGFLAELFLRAVGNSNALRQCGSVAQPSREGGTPRRHRWVGAPTEHCRPVAGHLLCWAGRGNAGPLSAQIPGSAGGWRRLWKPGQTLWACGRPCAPRLAHCSACSSPTASSGLARVWPRSLWSSTSLMSWGCRPQPLGRSSRSEWRPPFSSTSRSPRWRIVGGARLVVVSFVFFALFPLLLVSAQGPVGLVAALLCAGLRELGEPARKVLIVDLAAADQRGRMVGVYYCTRGLMVMPASLIGGLLWQLAPRTLFLVAGVICLRGWSSC